jgi:hypothetical protein
MYPSPGVGSDMSAHLASKACLVIAL